MVEQNLNNHVDVTKFVSLLWGDLTSFNTQCNFCFFVFFVNLSSLSSLLVLEVHNNLLNRSCLQHVLMTIQKKMC